MQHLCRRSPNSAVTIATIRSLFRGVYLQNAHAFSIIGGCICNYFEVGVWGNVRIRGNRHELPFLDMECSSYRSRSCLFLETLFLQEGSQCFSGTSKEEITLWKKKPLETNRTLVRGLEGFLKSLEMEYQFEQKIR